MVYYYKDFWLDNDNRLFRIYAFNTKTGKTQAIRELHACVEMESIFMDNRGRLYYVTQSTDMSFILWLYQKAGDRLIGSACSGVMRVDDRFIYTDDLWYSLDDYSPHHGDAATFSPWLNSEFITTAEPHGDANKLSVQNVKPAAPSLASFPVQSILNPSGIQL